MSWLDIPDGNQLTWRFMVIADDADFYDTPTPGVDPPDAWVDAIVAVAHDLRYFRYGRDVNPDRLMWRLSTGPGDAVVIGWNETAGISGLVMHGGALRAGASFVDAARWVADAVQGDLAGYDFVQWPSQGGYLLSPRCIDDAAVWFDRHTDCVIAPIGGLHEAMW